MEFARRVWLALGICVLGVSYAAAAAASSGNAVTYWVPPYSNHGDWYNGPWPSVSVAIQESWTGYQLEYPGAFPGCSYVLQTFQPNSLPGYPGIVASMTFKGTCAGGNWISATPVTTNPAKDLGNDCRSGSGQGGKSCPNLVGEPINAATGNEYEEEEDYTDNHWLTFRRFYNSAAAMTSAGIGLQWRHSFDRTLSLQGSPVSAVVLIRPDGTQEGFAKSNGVWTTDSDVADQLLENDNAQGAATSYTLFVSDLRQYETYDASTGLLQSVIDSSGQGITLTYSTTSTPTSIAPAAGLLITVTDPKGRQLNFSYNANGFLHQVTLPDSGLLTYSYDAAGNLLSVQYPDNKTRQYVYNESAQTGGANLPSALTGIIDEAGVRYVYATYNSNGLATSSSFAGNVGTTQVIYNGDGTSTVQFPLGASVTLGFSKTTSGLTQAATVSAPCGPQCNQPWQTRTYDPNGYPASYVDFNGNVTATTYSNNGLLTQQIDAKGTTSQRTTTFTWDSALRVPLTRSVLNASGSTVSSTLWLYNGTGQTLARCEVDPTNSAASGYTCSNTGTVPSGVRRWTYTYCAAVDNVQCPLLGLLLTASGPRTDLTQTTTYRYYLSSSAVSCGTPGGACYQAGDLHTITDALGHITTIVSYDGAGRVTRITDANSTIIDLTYTPRGWLSTHTVGGAKTTFGYTPYGAVQTITDPDGVTTTFGYDPAHRLNQVTDAQGNYIKYTLDAAGNKTAEQTYDASGTLHKSLSRTFNTLGQLTTVIDGLNHTVFNASATGNYDADGNLLQSTDALGIQRKLGYDALNRLKQAIDNYNGTDTTTQNTTTGYSYDGLDRLTQVTDPSNLATTYNYNGLSDATGQQSPDTGTTSRVPDAAGNTISRTDARGVVAQYTYDALNRVTRVIYPAHPTLNVTYTYDEATPISGCPSNANIGHLTTMTDASGTTSWCYTPQGDIREVRQVINNVVYLHGYAYTPGRRLKYLQYPSGFELVYGYDADGRVNSINYLQQPGPYGSYTNSTATPLITSVSYLPFGPVSGYTYAQNGQSVSRTYDANYRLTDLVSSGLTLHFSRDAKGRIQAEGNNPDANPASETYQYDSLDRLKTLLDANGAVEQSFTYNPTGDRLSKTTPSGTQSYTYATGTHQLNGVGGIPRSVDAAGNTTAMTGANGAILGLGYDDTNRLTAITSGGATIASYQYNGEGQRVYRTITQPSAGQASTVYDPAGTGNLYGEYFAADYREYVYLNGEVVASATDAGKAAPSINYLYADHLGTLRAVVSPTGGAPSYTWPWLNNAFGDQPSTGAVAFYTRFPGQYYDVESGLNFNNNRFYDSLSGRYLQADPMGYGGGQVSLYLYVNAGPLNSYDPLGLTVYWYARPTHITGDYSWVNDFGITHQWIKTDTYEAGMGPMGGGVPGQDEPPDAPGVPVGTIDHAGQSDQSGSYSIPLPYDVDEDCVNDMIKPGQDLGRFLPGINDCHTFVQQVLQHCRKHKTIRTMPIL